MRPSEPPSQPLPLLLLLLLLLFRVIYPVEEEVFIKSRPSLQVFPDGIPPLVAHKKVV